MEAGCYRVNSCTFLRENTFFKISFFIRLPATRLWREFPEVTFGFLPLMRHLAVVMVHRITIQNVLGIRASSALLNPGKK